MDEITANKGGYAYLIDWIVHIGDLLLINAFFFVLSSFYFQYYPEHILDYSKKFESFLLINLLYFVVATFIRCHLSDHTILMEKILQQATGFIALYVLALAACFTIYTIVDAPMSHWIFVFLTLGTLFCLWHVGFRSILKAYRRKGYNYRNVVIVGGGRNAIDTFNELKSVYTGYRIAGYFDDNNANVKELPTYLGKLNDIEEYSNKNHIDEIYFTLADNVEKGRITSLVTFCENNMVRIHIVPDLHHYIKKKLSLHFLESIPILSIRHEPLQHPLNRMMKRVMDVLISGVFLVTVYPLVYIIIGALIKLSSPGKIYFKQKRTGVRGEDFYCYKFRSMMDNPDANKKMATKDDPRVTKIGAFIRKTSIDELPQFLNVIKGEMSVVGPRPHMLKHTQEYSKIIEKYMIRHLVKPGITGWAQVTGSRGETKTVEEMETRVKKDVWYIENWSLFLDVKIIFRTAVNVFKGEEKAY